MKILYLAHPEQDYGEYYLFNGLCYLYGSNNIVTYPFKKSYYGLVDKDYILDSGDKGYTAPGEYIIPKPMNQWDLEEIVNRIAEFNIIILSSGRTYAVQALREIIERFGKCPLPLVFTDHEDGDNIREDIIDAFKPDAVFKRELIRGSRIPNVMPLPFSSAIDSFPDIDDQEEKYSIFCCLGSTWPLRREITEKLIEMDYPESYISLDSQIRGDFQEKNKPRLSYKDYLTKIAQSKIAITVRGHGRDTVRYWEIAGYQTLMFICDPGIEIPNNFIDGETAVFFKEDFSDLKEKLDYYLSHEEERVRIAQAGKEHLRRWHTNQKRAEYFIDALRSKGVLNDNI